MSKTEKEVAQNLEQKPGAHGEERFMLSYDGRAHSDHRIDIETLGASITALSNLLYDSTALVTGSRSDIDVQVAADFKEGSFGIEVAVLLNSAEALSVIQAIGLTAFAGASTGSVLAILSKLRGQKIELIETEDDTSKVIFEGGEYETDAVAAKIIGDSKIRTHIKNVIAKPLNREGTESVKIDTFESRNDSYSNVFEATKEDAESYSTLQAISQKSSKFSELKVRFVAADIVKNSGWRIKLENGRVYNVQMKDKTFVERLQNMEEPHLFGKDFHVRLEVVKTTKLDKQTQSRRIINVHNK